MVRLSVLVLLASTGAYALPQPSPFPSVPIVCQYEGVFAGSGVSGRWSYTTTADGKFTVGLQSGEQVSGILNRQLGDRVASVTSWDLSAHERMSSGLLQTRYQLRATVKLKHGEPTNIVNTVDIELACRGFPRNVTVGARWQCREKVIDGWEWERNTVGIDAGSRTISRNIDYHYISDQRTVAPGMGEVTAALIQMTDDKGDKERYLVATAFPWCPIRVERIKAGRVVGTDNLVAWERAVVSAPVPPQPPKHSDNGLSWTMAFIAVCGLVVGIALGKFHRKRLM